MILLTKLDGKKILLCLETVKYIESIPDTLVFFLNGESVIVMESLEEVVQKVKGFKSELLRDV
ncbi:MAG: flagellar FlbD family protein [Oligoflexales bacterium]